MPRKIEDEKELLINAQEAKADEQSFEEQLEEAAAERESEEEGQLTIDVYQRSDEIVIKSTIAGVKPDDLDIAINNDIVTIRGVRKKDEEVDPKDYYYQECYWGPFSRSVILPVDIDAEKSVATLKNGILTIRLPKLSRVRSKKLKVKID